MRTIVSLLDAYFAARIRRYETTANHLENEILDHLEKRFGHQTRAAAFGEITRLRKLAEHLASLCDDPATGSFNEWTHG